MSGERKRDDDDDDDDDNNNNNDNEERERKVCRAWNWLQLFPPCEDKENWKCTKEEIKFWLRDKKIKGLGIKFTECSLETTSRIPKPGKFLREQILSSFRWITCFLEQKYKIQGPRASSSIIKKNIVSLFLVTFLVNHVKKYLLWNWHRNSTTYANERKRSLLWCPREGVSCCQYNMVRTGTGIQLIQD